MAAVHDPADTEKHHPPGSEVEDTLVYHSPAAEESLAGGEPGSENHTTETGTVSEGARGKQDGADGSGGQQLQVPEPQGLPPLPPPPPAAPEPRPLLDGATGGWTAVSVVLVLGARGMGTTF